MIIIPNSISSWGLNDKDARLSNSELLNLNDHKSHNVNQVEKTVKAYLGMHYVVFAKTFVCPF